MKTSKKISVPTTRHYYTFLQTHMIINIVINYLGLFLHLIKQIPTIKEAYNQFYLQKINVASLRHSVVTVKVSNQCFIIIPSYTYLHSIDTHITGLLCLSTYLSPFTLACYSQWFIGKISMGRGKRNVPFLILFCFNCPQFIRYELKCVFGLLLDFGVDNLFTI